MKLEDEVFARCTISTDKLLTYGFKQENNTFIYQKKILNNTFEIILEYSNKISGKIIDLSLNEEYINFRINQTGTFSKRVREEFLDLLIDIQKNCCIKNLFISNQANTINQYIQTKYHIEPEFLWKSYPNYAIYRNSKEKWFSIIMDIPYNKVNKNSNNTNIIEVINVKIDPKELNDLLKKNGIYEAYHMNKKYWVSIVLNEYLVDEELFNFIDNSYKITMKGK